MIFNFFNRIKVKAATAINNMSFRIKRSILSKEDVQQMEKKLMITQDSPKKFNAGHRYPIAAPKTPFFHVFGEDVHVPFHWGLSYFGYHYRPEKSAFAETQLQFFGQLRPEQAELQSTAVRQLEEHGSCLFAVYPGWGKTITALSIIPALQTVTLIVVNKIVLLEQWQIAIRNTLHLEPTIIKGGKTKWKPSLVYIVNAINLPKHDQKTLKNLNIGMVIVDECHLILTKVFSRALFTICPRYLLGLSATPHRSDGFDQLFDLYFGVFRIQKSLHQPHQVLCVSSKIPIAHEIGKTGSINWNSVIERQSDLLERQTIICNYVCQYASKNILILCKRIKQMLALQDALAARGETSTYVFKESDTQFDRDARILISSYQKVGTGFSHDKLDMLILGCDTEEYFLQYLGRVFRRQQKDCTSQPLILDIVDEHPVLWKHYRTRAKVYRSCGGSIKKIKL